jgi:cytochrome c-type biogenesis protein CcmE
MNKRVVFAGMALAAFALLGWYALQNSSVEYCSIARAKAIGKTVQVTGAWVKEAGCSYNANENVFSFVMRDESGEKLPVRLHGAKPNNFELSTKVVAQGAYNGGVFNAHKVLTKCPSKYEGQAES